MKTPFAIKLDSFFTRYSFHHFSRGDILIRAGVEPQGIYFLKKGHVRQYVITKEGKEVTLNIYKPGAFFPMACAVDAYPNTHYFEAMNSVDAWSAPKADVVTFIRKEPDILFDLLQRLYRGLDGILSRLEFLMSGNARQKLITILVISAKRFGEKEKGSISIHLKLSHQDLASLAGLSRETVSREMKILRERKLIGYANTTSTIYNIADLENELIG